MAKVDLSRDYYGDLDLPLGSSEADVKKAFKKLALKYHPDRNPGREAEVNSKFQTINTAHEILTDPAQKSKYDAGRRAGRGAASSFKTAASGTYARGNPWASAGSEWAPPPKRETARPSKPPPASAGAQRYTSNFTTPNPNTPPRPPPYDAEANKRNWEAWNNMRNAGATKAPPFTPMPPRQVPKEYTPQSGREESNSFKHPPPPKSSKPGYEEFRAGPASFGKQPIPQRPPPPPARKSGFTPHTPGGDEPAAPKTSAYFTRRDSRPSMSAYPDNEAPPVPGGRPEPKFAKETRFVDDDSGATLEPRISMPYASHGGEKLNPFDTTPLSRTKSSSERAPPPFSPNSDRHRSFSPPRTRMHRHVSPDFVPRADSAANLEGRGNGSPKRTLSSATRNNHPRGKPAKFYPRVESETSDSEDEMQPRRPIAKSRLKRTGTSQKLGSDNTGAVQTDNQNSSASSGASGPSPAYDIPSQCQRLHKSSLLPTVFEDYSSLTSGPQEMAELSNFKYSKKATTAFSEATAMELPNLHSASADSSPEEDIVHTPNGSLNPFEKKQFHLLEQLVKHVKSRGSPSHFDSPYDGIFSEMELGQNTVESQQGNRSYTLPTLRQAYESSHVPSSIAYELGSPNKIPRKVKHVSTDQRLHDVTKTDHAYSSFSFKTTVDSDRPSYRFTSNSEENINTNFMSEEWVGKFGDGDNHFAPTPGEPSREGTSGTKSGRRSPTKRGRPNRPTVGNGTSIPSIDPEVRGQPVDEEGYSASPGGTKFKPEEWAQTFKAQTFEFPQTIPAGSSARRGPHARKSSKIGSKGPSVTRTTGTAAIVNEDSSSDDPLYMKRPSATESSGVESPNAMDIDSPGETRQDGGTQPRNVGVEPSNPAWRDQSNASRPVPDPPLPPRSPNTNTSKPISKDEDELKVKLEDLKNVEPLQQSSAGLKSFSDLNSQLPWTSRAASFVPLSHSVSTGKINLPHPPKLPPPPAITAETMRPTVSAWKIYADHFKAYMNAWRVFDEAMISHFVARRQQVNEMGEEFQNEFGDVKLDKYERGLGEDKTIMAWWEEAARRHAAAMQEFRGWKSTFREGATASRLT